MSGVGLAVADTIPRDAARVDRRDAIARHFLNRGRGLEFEMEARWIQSQLPDNCDRIADVGCGNGALFPWVGTDRVVGFDFAPEGLLLTRDRFSDIPLVGGQAEHLPVAAESFDAIVMQHVIEHLSEVDQAARGWNRALRAGGRVIIVTPNADFVDPSIYDDPTHTRIFTRTELRDVMAHAGFEIDDTRTLGLPYFRDCAQRRVVWRLRRGVVRGATLLSRIPGLAGAGQSLCCVARKVRR